MLSTALRLLGLALARCDLSADFSGVLLFSLALLSCCKCSPLSARRADQSWAPGQMNLTTSTEAGNEDARGRRAHREGFGNSLGEDPLEGKSQIPGTCREPGLRFRMLEGSPWGECNGMPVREATWEVEWMAETQDEQESQHCQVLQQTQPGPHKCRRGGRR